MYHKTSCSQEANIHICSIQRKSPFSTPYFLYTDKEVWEANLEEVGGGSERP